MPYASNADLPASVRDKYGERCSRAFVHAFNSAYADHGESRAFAIAHAAAKKCQEAQKAMPDLNVAETTTPKSAQFRIFSGQLTPFDGSDGKKRLRTIASSSVEDLGGDVVTQQALERMAASAKGMTVFRNHSYKVPQDILGTTEKAEVRHAGMDGNNKPIYDLVLDVVLMDSPDNNQTYDAVEAGVQLGTSIGAMIPQGGARKGDNGGIIFDDLRLLEASIVGIPQNPRSWVQYATKAMKMAEESPDEEEDTNIGFTTAAADPELDKGTAWVEATPDGVKVTLQTDQPAEPVEDNKKSKKDVEPEIIVGEAGPEVAFTLPNEIEVPDPDNESSTNLPNSESEADEETPAQEPGDGDPESADADVPEAEAEEAETKEADADLDDSVTRGAEILADLVKTMSRERIGLVKRVEEAEHARDAALQRAKDAEGNLEVAKEIVKRIANSPLGRKAVYREAVDDFNVRMSGIYSPDILKMLEKKDDGN